MVMAVSCTSPSSYIDGGGSRPSYYDSDIIDYIDKRLTEEYYWLDEVVEKRSMFNRNTTWDRYLPSVLGMLTTNEDDGGVNNNGVRAYYSYIKEIEDTTRAATSGFGILLYYTIITFGDGRYGFIVTHVYEGSPAAEAGICRGDIIRKVNGDYISQTNYQTLFNALAGGSIGSVRLELQRTTTESEQGGSYVVALERGSYEESPVAHYEVIEWQGRRIAYLAYLSYDNDYDEELIAALASLQAEGFDEFVLDLRHNSGGNVLSAIALTSSLLGGEYEGSVLCELRRNPRNVSSNETSTCYLENTGVNLGLKHVTILCSPYTASASELTIMGLRGLDIPVTLIGATTEGKNCGMDVTRRTIGGKRLEYAPITFICFNAKGVSDWGGGISPDVSLIEENSLGVTDKYYPMPRCDWGDIEYDVALAAALRSITGENIVVAATTRSDISAMEPVATIPAPAGGILLYEDGQ